MIATALVASLLFGLASFAFLYTVEDRIFSEALEEEVDRQRRAWARQGAFIPPLRDHTRLYRSEDPLPADLGPQFDWSASQSEYYGGAGRHYHVQRFTLPGGGGQAAAVAEVSRYLLVRPRRPAIITLLAMLTAGIALVAGVIGYVLARRTVAPLSLLAERLSSRDSDVPAIDPADYPRNEIGLFATALGQSFSRVRAAIDREQAFTRDVSHELRTPLAVIRSGAELAASSKDASPQVQTTLGRITEAARDAEQALDLLLALAREPGKPVDCRPVRVLPLVEKAVLDSASRYPDRNIRLSVAIDPVLEIAAPQPAIQLILNNLVGNAFQHASGSDLTISAGPNWIEIADTGPGLADEVAFQPFQKGFTSPGSGLGLEIVRRLCEQSRIALTVAAPSTSGACFRLNFQRSPPAKG